MSRLINISNEKERNSEIVFENFTPKQAVFYQTSEKEKAANKKIIKGVAEHSSEGLLSKYDGDPEKLAEALIESDPEVDMEITGQFLTSTTRVYIGNDQKVVFRIRNKEFVFLPDGSLKEEREPRYLRPNVCIDAPLKWSGKYMPKKDAYNKFIFARKYQLKHTSGLTYDFLFDMAKQLHEKKSLMLVGSGAKGMGPLIFQEGGKPFRAFLEGRIDGNKYLLIMHLSNLELKPIPTK